MQNEVISARRESQKITGLYRCDNVFYSYEKNIDSRIVLTRLDEKPELTTKDIADFLLNLRNALNKVSPTSKIDTFKINPKDKTVSGVYSTKFEKFAFKINSNGSISTKGVKAKTRLDAIAMTLQCGQTSGSRQCGGRCLPSDQTCHIDNPDVITAGTQVLNHVDQLLTHGIDAIASKYQELAKGASNIVATGKQRAVSAIGGVDGAVTKSVKGGVTAGVNYAIHAAGAATGVGKVAGAFANAGLTIGKMIKKKSVEYSNEKQAKGTSRSIADQRKVLKQIKPLRVRVMDELKSKRFQLTLEKNFVKDLSVGAVSTAATLVNPVAGAAVGLGLGGKIGTAAYEALRKSRRKVRKK